MGEISYPDEYVVRQVRIGGPIKWKGELLYVSKTLTGEPVGLKQLDEQLWQVYFSTIPIGLLDESIGRTISL